MSGSDSGDDGSLPISHINDSVTEGKSQPLEQSTLGIDEQIRTAVAQAEERARLAWEDDIRAAVAETVSRLEERSRSRIEKLEAEVHKNEDVSPRNLVVCIDGTANQFGVKVRTRTTTPTAALQ